jgi:hypothetical protein
MLLLAAVSVKASRPSLERALVEISFEVGQPAAVEEFAQRAGLTPGRGPLAST